MLIICSVAAEFVNSEGERFAVTGKELGLIKDAPEWIKKTLLFKWMAKDGSVKFVTDSNRVKAENDPMAGLDAEGKQIKLNTEKGVEGSAEGQQDDEKPAEEKPKTKPKTATKKKEKKEDAEEPKKDDA